MPVRDELNDIQGLIVRPFATHFGARFVLLQVRDAAQARAWLAELNVQTAADDPGPEQPVANIAFTPAGLTALGLASETLAMFSAEFVEGMSTSEHRRRILGDVDTSAPEQWRWGGPNNPPVHLMLLLYAADDASVLTQLHTFETQFDGAGLDIVEALDANSLPDNKEHFGFRDGIANPGIAGSRSSERATDIAAGEFILGYPNAYGQMTPRPLIPTEHAHELPRSEADNGGDLGRNGSYLVFRQLSQDVQGFWRFVDASRDTTDTESAPTTRVKLAAKMVGRWPSGAPLVKRPDHDDPALADDDDFLYYGSGDPDGLKCPIGSHIRRSNPRDALDPNPGSETSIEVGNRHRIIRRGRPYGPPVAASMDPADILAQSETTPPERGLHFLCFNSHIGRQFEFIQHTWANNPKFDGLYDDDDPITGARHDGSGAAGGTFTIQQEPVRRRVTGMPRFVEMRGGAYFFVPGLRALRYLANLA